MNEKENNEVGEQIDDAREFESSTIDPTQDLEFPIVEEVRRSGADEIVGFQPTREELLQLAKHWAREAVEWEFYHFRFPVGVSSSEWRHFNFVQERLSRIRDVLGNDDVLAVVDSVYDEIRAATGDRLWNIFLNGDAAERHAVREEIGLHEGHFCNCVTDDKPDGASC